jgi:hypothetical protein
MTIIHFFHTTTGGTAVGTVAHITLGYTSLTESRKPCHTHAHVCLFLHMTMCARAQHPVVKGERREEAKILKKSYDISYIHTCLETESMMVGYQVSARDRESISEAYDLLGSSSAIQRALNIERALQPSRAAHASRPRHPRDVHTRHANIYTLTFTLFFRRDLPKTR